MREIKQKPQAKVLVGAKIPIDVRNQIVKKAESEQRSISQVVARLLSSHPEICKHLAINPYRLT